MDLPSLLELAVLSLAVTRLTLLVSRDTIFDTPRHWLYMLSPPPDDEESGRRYQCYFPANKRERAIAKEAGVPWYEARLIDTDEPNREAGFFGSLVSCPHCVAVWASAAMTVSYGVAREVTLAAALVLALAMLSSLIVKRGGFE